MDETSFKLTMNVMEEHNILDEKVSGTSTRSSPEGDRTDM